MPFWRRDEPVHEKLAREGGLRPPPDDPPPDRRLRFIESLVGIHGVHRQREWDVVATADAPGLVGDRHVVVVLPDSTLLIEEGPGGEIEPLSAAVEETLQPPYRLEAVRQGEARFAVAALAIEVVELDGVDGDRIIVVEQDDETTVEIDGEPALGTVPELEHLARNSRGACVVTAERLDGDLFEVQVSPL